MHIFGILRSLRPGSDGPVFKAMIWSLQRALESLLGSRLMPHKVRRLTGQVEIGLLIMSRKGDWHSWICEDSGGI